MWTMKFSRETRERVSDFILLGQIVTYMVLSHPAVFCSLLCLSCVAFVFGLYGSPRKKKLGKKNHARKPFGKKSRHQYEKVDMSNE